MFIVSNSKCCIICCQVPIITFSPRTRNINSDTEKRQSNFNLIAIITNLHNPQQK